MWCPASWSFTVHTASQGDHCHHWLQRGALQQIRTLMIFYSWKVYGAILSLGDRWWAYQWPICSSFHLVVILLQQKLQCAGNYNMPTFTCAHEVVIHSPCDHGATCMVLTNVFYRPKQLVKLNYPHEMSCCPYISSVLVCLLFKRPFYRRHYVTRIGRRKKNKFIGPILSHSQTPLPSMATIHSASGRNCSLRSTQMPKTKQ